jgi:coniferyl-aldehyde dehydrogenase
MQLTVQSHIEQTVIEQTLHDCFQLQRKSFHQQGIETIAQRKQHLLNLKALINDHREAIIDALNRDYGNRSRHETLLAEIITVTDDINGSIKHLKHKAAPKLKTIPH